MCCELFLKYFRDYDEIEESYDNENYFDKAVKLLYKNERGLVLHYTTCGMITFSERFVRWYRELPDPFFTFMSEFSVVQATCEIKQLFYMGKLTPDKHYLFFILIRDYYSDI
jgi:hypothetical protein